MPIHCHSQCIDIHAKKNLVYILYIPALAFIRCVCIWHGWIPLYPMELSTQPVQEVPGQEQLATISNYQEH